MPFSKYDPHRPVEETPEASDPSAARRVWILRWAWRIAWGYTVLGFAFLLWWILRK